MNFSRYADSLFVSQSTYFNFCYLYTTGGGGKINLLTFAHLILNLNFCFFSKVFTPAKQLKLWINCVK